MQLRKFVAVAGELKTEYRIYSYVNDDELIGIDKVKSDGFFNEAYYQLCLGDKIAVFDHTGILVWLEVSYCDKGIVKTTEISTGGATGGGTNAGIKGDYFATWGWMEGEGGLLTIISGGNNIKIPAGIIMMCPGTDGYITFTGDTTYVNELTEDFTVFYARNIDGTGATFLGATDVIFGLTLNQHQMGNQDFRRGKSQAVQTGDCVATTLATLGAKLLVGRLQMCITRMGARHGWILTVIGSSTSSYTQQNQSSIKEPQRCQQQRGIMY